jgi:hypothetical protein
MSPQDEKLIARIDERTEIMLGIMDKLQEKEEKNGKLIARHDEKLKNHSKLLWKNISANVALGVGLVLLAWKTVFK